eukprot:3853670-Prymnesium_polylepis.1
MSVKVGTVSGAPGLASEWTSAPTAFDGAQGVAALGRRTGLAADDGEARAEGHKGGDRPRSGGCHQRQGAADCSGCIAAGRLTQGLWRGALGRA